MNQSLNFNHYLVRRPNWFVRTYRKIYDFLFPPVTTVSAFDDHYTYTYTMSYSAPHVESKKKKQHKKPASKKKRKK